MEYTFNSSFDSFNNDTDMSKALKEQFDSTPGINVVSKEVFENRAKTVFKLLLDTISKSFGPGGSGAFISVYPAYYNTKDGFTIMKNIAFDKKVDQIIADMVSSICDRLNFTVGDGTSTAVIATNMIYESYLKNKDSFKQKGILPRDILNKMEIIKQEVIQYIDSHAVQIRSDDPETLKSNIEKVVYISSNGNEEITKLISELYGELMYPAISVKLAKDGITKSIVTKGYKIDVSLTDKLYVNNDNNSLALDGADFIIFDHKVGRQVYDKILKPLSLQCYGRGRHLICIAPYYDEVALNGVIANDLNMEYRAKKDITLVLTTSSKVNAYARKKLSDLAMLLNTDIITSDLESIIMSGLNEGKTIFNFFNIDNRDIEGLTIATMDTSKDKSYLKLYSKDINNDMIPYSNIKDSTHRLGYCDKLEIGLKESTFSGFYYDKDVYNLTMKEAMDELDEMQKKTAQIGTFSLTLGENQERVYSLGLKAGVIEVGATSEISQGYLKDTVDDAVKAAASAYNNGVILGCNVTTIMALEQMLHVYSVRNDELGRNLVKMLMLGYHEVYATVIKNVLQYTSVEGLINSLDEDTMKKLLGDYVEKVGVNNISEDWLIDRILDYSTNYEDGIVFDLTKYRFSKDIINSANTDKEILKATIDLLGLLITGNQLVVR